MTCPCREKTIVRSHTYLVDIGGIHVFQGSMTSSDTGPMLRCTPLMSFLHARRHKRLPTPFIGRIPIGFLCIPSPSSLRLARRNVRNSSDYSMVRPRYILHCLAVSDSSSTDPGQQSSLSYMRMVTRILLRVGMFCFCIDCTEVLSCTRSTLAPGPLQAAQTPTPRHQPYAHCKAHTDPAHGAGNCRWRTMPRDPVSLRRQSEIQYLGDTHDPTRIGQYSPDWRFGRHLMLCAEHDHIFRIYFPV